MRAAPLQPTRSAARQWVPAAPQHRARRWYPCPRLIAASLPRRCGRQPVAQNQQRGAAPANELRDRATFLNLVFTRVVNH